MKGHRTGSGHIECESLISSVNVIPAQFRCPWTRTITRGCFCFCYTITIHSRRVSLLFILL